VVSFNYPMALVLSSIRVICPCQEGLRALILSASTYHAVDSMDMLHTCCNTCLVSYLSAINVLYIMWLGCLWVDPRHSHTAHLCPQAVVGRCLRHTHIALLHQQAVSLPKLHSLCGRLACLQEVCQYLVDWLLLHHVRSITFCDLLW